MPENNSDHLVRAGNREVRVFAAVTTELVREGTRRHDCGPLAAAALGRVMTGALLLAANLKNDEALTLCFDGDGPLGKIVADATPSGFVRGYVEHPYVELPLAAPGKLAVGEGVGRGIIKLTRFTGLKDPVVGSAQIKDGEIANDLTHYLYQSEQTPSGVGLGVLADHDGVKAAGGFVVQPLPSASEATLTRLEQNLSQIQSVSSMVEDGLTAEDIIARLLDGLPLTFGSDSKVAFRCQCSRGRIADTLIGLGKETLATLLADGQAEVVCHFCNEKYRFTANELKILLATAEKYSAKCA